MSGDLAPRSTIDDAEEEVERLRWQREMDELTAGFVREIHLRRMRTYAVDGFPMRCDDCGRAWRFRAEFAYWPTCPYCRLAAVNGQPAVRGPMARPSRGDDAG